MTELFTLSKRCAHGFVQQSQCEACKTESSLAAIEIENSRLRGESKVLRDLLILTLPMIESLDGETQPECDLLTMLVGDIKAALLGTS